MRIAFITEKLQLTPSESEQFWPLFNEYHKEMKSLRSAYKSPHDFILMTDNEVEDFRWPEGGGDGFRQLQELGDPALANAEDRDA